MNTIEQKRAHYWVASAILRGEIVRQSCEVCNQGGKTHAHHPDYSQPTLIKWLCPRHHKELHPRDPIIRGSGAVALPMRIINEIGGFVGDKLKVEINRTEHSITLLLPTIEKSER
jgi:hypothetical protein